MKSYCEIPVRGYHLDMFSHVNNARYLEFLEEARWDNLEGIGFGYSELVSKGLVFAIVNININYRYPATVGDVLVIETGVDKMGARSITMGQKITLKENGRDVVDAAVTFVVLDGKTGSPLELNDDIRGIFISGEEGDKETAGDTSSVFFPSE